MVDGRVVTLGQPRQRAVFAVLAVRAPHSVSLSDLVDAVWGDNAPASAEGSLHTYVGALRQALEPDRPRRAPSTLLVTTGAGYALRLDRNDRDVDQFDRAVLEAGRQYSSGELAAAADRVRTALQLWRGTPLADVPGPFADNQRTRLADSRLAAVVLWARIALDLGAHHEVTHELGKEVRDHPLHEELAGLRMLGLYRAGRQADALAAFHDIRRTLADELGIDPGPELRALHQRILASDPDLIQPVSGAARVEPAREPEGVARPTGTTTLVVPAQLPHDVASFVGRGAEVARLVELLSPSTTQTAIVISAIDGTGGIGKTALAVHACHQLADRFPDGQLHIDLHGFDPTHPPTDPSNAVAQLLRGLGVDPAGIPLEPDERFGLYRSVLAGRSILLLLDNATDANQVRPLLPGTPTCSVIVTSRNRLAGLVAHDGAHRITLDVLPDHDAINLLTTVIGTRRATTEPDAVRDLARLCGRLPLALRIAGERIAAHPHLTLTDLADELEHEHDRLDLLTADDTTAVRATFSWSYHALKPQVARTFRLLGRQPSSEFSLPAVAALTDQPIRTARAQLDALCSGHLVEEIARDRYKLHDLLRDYARERVSVEDSPAESYEAVDRVLRWYLGTADSADHLVYPARRRLPIPSNCTALPFAGRDEALAWLDQECASLVAATQFAEAQTHHDFVWRLPTAMLNYFKLRSDFDNLRTTHELALVASRRCGNVTAEAFVLNNLGLIPFAFSAHEEAITYFEQALALWRRIGDDYGQGQALLNIASILVRMHAYDDAELHYTQSVEMFQRTGRPEGVCAALLGFGFLYQETGRNELAITKCQELLPLCQSLSMGYEEAFAYELIGLAHEALGNLDAAMANYHRFLDVSRRIDGNMPEAEANVFIAALLQRQGRHDEATMYIEAAQQLFEELKLPPTSTIAQKLRNLRAEQSARRLGQTGSAARSPS